eukprot:4077102-Amphidinium_carterae.1
MVRPPYHQQWDCCITHPKRDWALDTLAMQLRNKLYASPKVEHTFACMQLRVYPSGVPASLSRPPHS